MLQSVCTWPRGRPCCHPRADAGPSRPLNPPNLLQPRNQKNLLLKQNSHAWVTRSQADDDQRPSIEPQSFAEPPRIEPELLSAVASEGKWSLASLGLGPHTQHSWLMSLAAFAGTAGLLGSGPRWDLDGPSSTAASIAIMAIIIVVHEAGHFAAARVQGIRVSKFCIGFGPALWTYKSAEGIEYSLCAFPVGGYVAFPEPPVPTTAKKPSKTSLTSSSSPAKPAAPPGPSRPATTPTPTYDPKDPDLLDNRPVWQRAIVVSAGVTANVVFALGVLFLQVMTVGRAETSFLPGVQVPLVSAGSPAQRAGLLKGDVIVSLGGQTVPAAFSQVRDAVRIISSNADHPLSVLVDRNGERLELSVVPEASTSEGRGRIGAELSSNVFINHVKARQVDEGARMAWVEFNRLSSSVLNGLLALVTDFNKVADTLSGPVAIVVAGSKIARTDVAGLFQFCALVNINLAMVNVLPLPALDGGFLVVLLLEALRGGKKLPAEFQENVTAGGMLLLLTLGLGLVVRDTINLF